MINYLRNWDLNPHPLIARNLVIYIETVMLQQGTFYRVGHELRVVKNKETIRSV